MINPLADSRQPSGDHKIPWRRRLIIAFAILFLGVYGLGVLTQQANRFLPYPFSNMAFYATLKALPPYNTHQPFMAEGVEVSAEVTDCSFDMDPRFLACSDNLVVLNGLYPPVFQYFAGNPDLEVRHRGLLQLSKHIRLDARYNNPAFVRRITALRFSEYVFRLPPYPEPLSLHKAYGGLLARLDVANTKFSAVKATVLTDTSKRQSDHVKVKLSQSGLPFPPSEVLAQASVRGVVAQPLIPVDWQQEGDFVISIVLPRGTNWSVLFSYSLTNQPNQVYWGFETLYRPWRDS